MLYVALGLVALKRARGRRGRALALLAALLAYAWMIGIAPTIRPAGSP
ncbi:MAG: hypothetical protein U1F06_10675 [Steroidobacteraceae bacterium]